MSSINNNKKLKVTLTSNELRKSCYWIVNKFKLDMFHQQQNSSRSDLIGGFFDRWLNKTPEKLIFDKLLENKNYSVVNDYFLYESNTAKNAPDILGLKDTDGNYYKFAVFNNDTWEVDSNSPFIEMKTFRKSQKLITIPETQFYEDHYYALVESHINEDYLTSIFDDDFYKNENLDGITRLDEFIKEDKNNELKNPTELTKENNLGYYELLGIFSGEELLDYAINVGPSGSGKPEKPRYLKEIEVKDNIKEKEDNTLTTGLYFHLKNEENNVPVNINVPNDSELTILNKGKSFVDASVEGNVIIDNKTLETGKYRLKFATFDRSSKKREIILSKDALASAEASSTNKLIEIFDNIVTNNRHKL